jgi:C-5 cytosine-specific DNA methylase
VTAERPPRARVCLDLFAGTGGASRAFADRGWRVVRLDLERAHSPDIIGDVERPPLAGSVDFLWASPPCTEFSDARPLPAGQRRFPSLELVFATLRLVRDLGPKYWVLENVRGAIPFLGVPLQKVGPWCLWGYFPPLRVSWTAQTYRKWAAGSSAVARAAVPYEVSLAMCDAVERHWGLSSLLDMRPFRRHRHVHARAADQVKGLWGAANE